MAEPSPAPAILSDTPMTEAYTLRRCRHCGATIAVREGQRLQPVTGTPHVCQQETD